MCINVCISMLFKYHTIHRRGKPTLNKKKIANNDLTFTKYVSCTWQTGIKKKQRGKKNKEKLKIKKINKYAAKHEICSYVRKNTFGQYRIKCCRRSYVWAMSIRLPYANTAKKRKQNCAKERRNKNENNNIITAKPSTQ